jgi:hypothetical protein
MKPLSTSSFCGLCGIFQLQPPQESTFCGLCKKNPGSSWISPREEEDKICFSVDCEQVVEFDPEFSLFSEQEAQESFSNDHENFCEKCYILREQKDLDVYVVVSFAENLLWIHDEFIEQEKKILLSLLIHPLCMIVQAYLFCKQTLRQIEAQGILMRGRALTKLDICQSLDEWFGMKIPLEFVWNSSTSQTLSCQPCSTFPRITY